jgi:hypothetical protein
VGTKAKVIEAVVLIALAVVAQIIVGVLGQVSYTAGNQICNGNFQSTSQGCTNYNTAGQSVTTVLNFLTIIFLVAALVILLSLFGLDKILRVGGGRGE